MANNWTSTTERYNYYGLIAPTDMQMNWIGADLLRVQWNDIYHIDVFVEVWASINGANPVLLGIAPKGATAIDITTDDSDDYLVFIRTAKDGAVSQFSKPLHSGSIQYYFIDPAGVDDPGRDGSNLEPWLTLAYACTRVTVPGEIIHVNAGIYTETITSVLAEGVSILGANEATTIITTAAALNPIIRLSSNAEGTNGNQSISNLTFDGNTLTALQAIDINARSNVLIHDCTFNDFDEMAVNFKGLVSGTGRPIIYATGNSLYNCTIDNCSKYNLYGRGAVGIGGQDGMLIYNNSITQTSRAAGQNGFLIKYSGLGYNKGIKIYNNNFERVVDNQPYHILLEFWNNDGGIEIYDNTLIGGCIDVAGSFSVKGSYDYSFYIHDNDMSMVINTIDYPVLAVDIEGSAQDVIVSNNYMNNFNYPIGISVGQPNVTIKNIYICYNIIENWGNTGTDNGSAIQIGCNQATAIIRDIYIFNNVMWDDGSGTDPRYGIWFNVTGGYYDNWVIRNNVIANTSIYWLRLQTGGGAPVFDVLRIENNDLFNNANANNYFCDAGFTPSSIINNNNINGNPNFIGGVPYNFHLQLGSPCINAGINVGWLIDYDGVAVANPPDIGCYEYV